MCRRLCCRRLCEIILDNVTLYSISKRPKFIRCNKYDDPNIFIYYLSMCFPYSWFSEIMWMYSNDRSLEMSNIKSFVYSKRIWHTNTFTNITKNMVLSESVLHGTNNNQIGLHIVLHLQFYLIAVTNDLMPDSSHRQSFEYSHTLVAISQLYSHSFTEPIWLNHINKYEQQKT